MQKLILGLSLFLVTSCISFDTMFSGDVNQDSIYQGYSLIYDSDGQNLRSSATLRAGGSGGTTLELSEPSRIYFDGRELSGNDFLGTSYDHNERLANPLRTWEWLFVDIHGREFRNTAALEAITVTGPASSYSAGQGMSVPFSAPNFRTDEVVSAVFDYTTRNSSGFAYVSGEIRGGSVFFRSDSVSDAIRAGDLTQLRYKLSRSLWKNLEQSTPQGGHIQIEYQTQYYSTSFNQ